MQVDEGMSAKASSGSGDRGLVERGPAAEERKGSAADSAVCKRHGVLGPNAFFVTTDVPTRRKRCKACAYAATSRWRMHHPHYRMWCSLLQRAKRHFGPQSTSNLTWVEHGRPLIERLIQQVDHMDAKEDPSHGERAEWVLIWQDGCQGLEMDKLVLVSKQEARVQSVRQRVSRLRKRRRIDHADSLSTSSDSDST